ncbi:MAG: recombination-associated protein RdgC [Deltaproteobacteria bacterium]|nr:recombination-associated protein RdgC [Deltaproteobacteria bacterium]
MGLIKGNPTLTRYRVVDQLTDEFTEDFIGERLRKFAFIDIEKTSEESSLGWVELLNELSYDFQLGSFRFGPNYAFILRQDSRKLPPKILNRYYAVLENDFVKKIGRKPNSVKKKELKENLRQDLMRRCLLSTDLYEVAWLTTKNELWLAGAGEKLRANFEDLWLKTFGLTIRLLVPVTLALELVPPHRREDILELVPSLMDGK